MVDKIKITNHSNNHSNKNQILPAYKKLLDYNENINNSDLCISYTRFLTELELLNNAISEAKNSKDDNTVEVLTKRKEYVQYTLKEMGSQNINMCTDTTSVQSALLSSLGISSTQANMQNLNQSVNIEQNENNAQISFKSKEKLQKNNESTKQIYLQLFDSAITYYEEQLVCDLDRKQDFLDELKKDKENLTQINVDDIDKNILKNLTKNYILDGYKKDNMALLNQLFEEKDEYNDFRFTGSSIFKILSAITPENKDIFNILLDSKDENNNFMFDEDTICDLL